MTDAVVVFEHLQEPAYFKQPWPNTAAGFRESRGGVAAYPGRTLPFANRNKQNSKNASSRERTRQLVKTPLRCSSKRALRVHCGFEKCLGYLEGLRMSSWFVPERRFYVIGSHVLLGEVPEAFDLSRRRTVKASKGCSGQLLFGFGRTDARDTLELPRREHRRSLRTHTLIFIYNLWSGRHHEGSQEAYRQHPT